MGRNFQGAPKSGFREILDLLEAFLFQEKRDEMPKMPS
jgi:hypothetical protein